MNGSFISVNYALLFVIVISLTFLFIGTYFSKKNLDLNSYLVSNRNVGVFKLTGTLVASSLGSWILFGPPTAAIDGGLGAIIGYALGTAFTMILLIFFGKKLRKIFPKGKSLTEIVLKKFGSNVFKLIFGLMMFYLFIFLCAEVTAISELIYYMSGLSVWISAGIILISVVSYVLFGGLNATIRTDTVQCIVIVLLFLYLLYVVVFQNSFHLNLNFFHKDLLQLDNKSLVNSLQFGFVFFVAVAATNLFHQGNWQRVYAAKNDKALAISLLVSFFIIYIIVFCMGLTGSIAKLNGLKFSQDLAFFSIILDKNNTTISFVILLFASCLCISTVDTLLNSISSLTIVHSKDFSNLKKISKPKQLSNIVLIFSVFVCFLIVLFQFSVLYLFLFADLLCCACVYVVFKGLYEKKVSALKSIILISIGLVTGLLLFPSEDFSKSLLIGVLFSKDIFSETFSKALLFWSFLFATLSPLFFDFIYRGIKRS
jgi:Na+/proline symporter